MWYPFKFWGKLSYSTIGGALAEETGYASKQTWKRRRRWRLALQKHPDFLVAAVDQSRPPDEPGCGTLTVADVSAPATTNEATQPIDDEPAAIAMSPLTPRASSMAVWTGTEVLVIGGEPRSTCPPGGDCIAPDFAPLADGAAYDPVTDTWRTLTDAPLNMSGNARPVVVADRVYVLVLDASFRPGGAGGFLEYEISSDTWRQLPTPGDGRYDIARFADTVMAFRNSDEAAPSPDLVFDGNSATWQPLPDDPLSPSFDRTMVSVDGELLLFAKDLVANPGSEQPSLVRTAAFDPASMTWTLRSDSEILGSESPITIGREVFFANSGSADGGQVNNWGRSYPYGGIYNADSDEWRSLPAPADDDTFRIAGVFGDGNSLVTMAAGHVLLTTEEIWVETPLRRSTPRASSIRLLPQPTPRSSCSVENNGTQRTAKAH